jgi:4-methyl-5(b-hydroxyethyl)-thiazole monophosphate biosynthesis
LIALFIADGFEEVEAITVADFLRRAGLDVRLVGLTGKRVTGSHNITVETDILIDGVPSIPEALIIPGGPGSENIANNKKCLEIIQSVYKKGGLIAAICAAPAVVLYPSGILKGKKVTSYPEYKDTFQDAVYVDERVVVDGRIITSQGPGTSAEFALKIVEILKNKATAQEIFKKTIQK